jgi:hypothetical protein
MPYTVIDNFNLGIDRKRPIYAAAQGSVWDAVNCHISRGGDIEKRKAFVKVFQLPVTCFGLCTGVSTIYTFGSAPAPSLPSWMTYKQCQHPTDVAIAMTAVLSSVLFDAKPYCIARFADGNVYHFYDGVLNADMQNAGGVNMPPKVGTVAYTFRSKIFTLADSLLEFSGINVPLGWESTVDTGAGYINMGNQFSGSANLTGIDVFQGNLALFAERAVQIWYIREDEAQNYQLQTLRNTGTVAHRSVLAYGDIDVFYLDYTGIRSLRARVPSNAAFINDIGTSIDTYVREWRDTIASSVIQNSMALIEPIDARFWMVMGSKAFVLSYFPAAQISAWTVYELTADGVPFEAKDAISYYDRVYILATDGSLYVYGGDSGQEYDSSEVTVQLPFIYGGKPDTNKMVTGMDIASTGTWSIDVLVDPSHLERVVTIGELSSVTTNQLNNAGLASTTHFAPRLTNNSDGYASLSQVMVAYSGATDATT